MSGVPLLSAGLTKTKNKLKKLKMAVLAVLLWPTLTMAQFNISGSVSENNKNLSGATIRLKGKTTTVSTNENARYEIKNLPAGSYTI